LRWWSCLVVIQRSMSIDDARSENFIAYWTALVCAEKAWTFFFSD